MGSGEITTISKAATTTGSIRTVIPKGIARQFNLKPGDKLDWSIEARDGGLIITMRKVKV
ncbi:MAG: AbrB/MazE/SpoVT family DNA-binding domain-containing protein [archaeon]|nr:AbrB/MazE/SpoVT family DNA-binding domain-containing protein [archaeon]MCP8313031.1 AbrB/MazE/SpoVT family DNA-binding domain-containing protein [archaeon]MCP8317439.1 AbrB/MazE/SpoVT family DNA-binding domain-containing protein [archaeon]MCP8320009.1 AbrB/MazE/SpoVT family DNA-binding domain-containing protein [archaeon]